jgi:hypothetical protein
MTAAIEPRTAGDISLAEENRNLRDDNRHMAEAAVQAGTAAAESRAHAQTYVARIAAINNYIATVDEATPWDTVRRDVAALSYGEREPGRERH